MKNKLRKYRRGIVVALVLALVSGGGMWAMFWTQNMIRDESITVSRGLQISKDGQDWRGDIMGEHMELAMGDNWGHVKNFYLRNVLDHPLDLSFGSESKIEFQSRSEENTLDQSKIHTRVGCSNGNMLETTFDQVNEKTPYFGQLASGEQVMCELRIWAEDQAMMNPYATPFVSEPFKFTFGVN